MSWKPVGGTGDGPRAKPSEVERANKAIAAMESAVKFDNIYKGKTVVIMGNANHLCDMDLTPLKRFPIISCNRILRPWQKGVPLTPNYIMMGDREPFCQERDSGRLWKFVLEGGHFLGTDSLFDPNVRLRGPYTCGHKENKGKEYTNAFRRRAQPPPSFPVHIYKIGTAGTRQPLHDKGIRFFPMAVKSFKERLESCQNVAGSLIQAAAIMGAKRILSVGIDLKWPKDKKNHTYTGSHGQHPQRTSIPYTLACFRWAKAEFKKRKIEFRNLSPVKDGHYASVWGNYPISKIKEEK